MHDFAPSERRYTYNDVMQKRRQCRKIAIGDDRVGRIAIGKILQGYVNDVAPVQAMVNRWIGPGSAVNLKQDLIKAYYATVLSTAAQLSLR